MSFYFFSYLSQTLSIFSLPALEDLFLLPHSVFSWVFPFFSPLPVLEWRFFWASYPPPFSLDVTYMEKYLIFVLYYFNWNFHDDTNTVPDKGKRYFITASIKQQSEICYLETLAPCSRVLLGKLKISQLVKKLPAVYGNCKFIIAFGKARQFPRLSQFNPPTTSNPISLRSILILSSHLLLGLPSDLFSSHFPLKSYRNLSSPPYVSHAPPTPFFLYLFNTNHVVTHIAICSITLLPRPSYFLHDLKALVWQSLLISEVSRSHSYTPHSAGLLWTSDHPDAQTSNITQHSQETDVHVPARHEPAIPESERPKTYVLDARPLGSVPRRS